MATLKGQLVIQQQGFLTILYLWPFSPNTFFPTHKDNFISFENQTPTTGKLHLSCSPEDEGGEEKKKCYGIWASVEVRHMVDKEHAAGRRAVEEE